MERILIILLMMLLPFTITSNDLKSNSKQNALSLNDQAVKQIEVKNFSSALLLINKSISLDSSNVMAYANKVAIYIGMKDFKNALITADKGLQVDPEYAELYVTAGAIYEILSDSSKAFFYYKKGIKCYERKIANPNPYDPIELSKSRFNRACLLIYCGRIAEGNLELKKLKADKHDIEEFNEFLKVDRQEYLRSLGIKKTLHNTR